MYQDVFWLSCEGNTSNTPPIIAYPPYVTLTVAVQNGTFLLDENALAVTYGLPVGTWGSYPVVQLVPLPNNLQLLGNVNGAYVTMSVQSSGQTIIGTLTADPPVPVDITIGSSFGQTVLLAGTASTPFELALVGDEPTPRVVPAAVRQAMG